MIGNSFVELANELKNSRKGLINIKSNDSKFFLWCHVRHLNLIKKHPERIKKETKDWLIISIMKELSFLFQKTITVRLKNKIVFVLTCFITKTELFISGEKFSDSIDLLLIFNENKSQYVYIKDFNRLMFNKTKNNKKYFRRCCLQCFSSENVLTEHKENCLVINGKQNVKLGKGSISFKNYSKQLPVPFKIFADFECILCPTLSNKVSDENGSYTEKYQDHIPCSFAYKVVYVDNKFSKDVVMCRGKNAAYKFIEAILKEYDYCKKIIKKHFNKKSCYVCSRRRKIILCWR